MAVSLPSRVVTPAKPKLPCELDAGFFSGDAERCVPPCAGGDALQRPEDHRGGVLGTGRGHGGDRLPCEGLQQHGRALRVRRRAGASRRILESRSLYAGWSHGALFDVAAGGRRLLTCVNSFRRVYGSSHNAAVVRFSSKVKPLRPNLNWLILGDRPLCARVAAAVLPCRVTFSVPLRL